MHITFDLTPAIHHHAGISRYAHELLSALTALDPTDEYCAFFAASRKTERPDPPLDRLPSHVVYLSAKPWRLTILLAYLTKMTMDRWLPASDVFHATDHLLPPLRRARTVFTVLDLTFRLFPEHHLPLNRWYSTVMLPRFLQRADAVIAISENTRRDLLNWVRLPRDKVKVIYLGVNRAFRPISDTTELARVRAKYHLPEQFILYFGTLEPRKNLSTLIAAYRALLARNEASPRLVLAGRKGWLYQPILEQVQALGLGEHVHFTDWIDDRDAPTILNAAQVLIYPSLYEGFGLPPLEAMACGTPVITSNTSSLQEVVGDAGIMVDPHDVRALAEAVELVLSDEEKRRELQVKGLKRAAQFTWEKAARETLAVYQQVVGQDKHAHHP